MSDPSPDRPPAEQRPDAEAPPVEDPRPEGLRTARSLVIVNTGDGKGKTTAALGVVLRALAQDWKVAVVQFLKSGDWKVGEETIARRLGVDWWAIGEGFSWESEDLDKDRETARLAWATARQAIESGTYRLVMLDEITYPLNWGWIPIDEVVATIAGRPERTSVICTGRDAPAALVEIADTVTEMRMVKHAYNQGIAAKKGIDY